VKATYHFLAASFLEPAIENISQLLTSEKQAAIGRNIIDRLSKKRVGEFHRPHRSWLKGKWMVATSALATIARTIFQFIICTAFNAFHSNYSSKT
jgi:hypothetical protein